MSIYKKPDSGQGFIYILGHPSMPNVYKVGFTTNSVKKRIQELTTTGVPKPFKAKKIFEIDADHLRDVEQLAHKKLKAKKMHYGKEFFKGGLSTCQEAVEDAIYEITQSNSVDLIGEAAKRAADKRQQQVFKEQQLEIKTKKLERINKEIDRIRKEYKKSEYSKNTNKFELQSKWEKFKNDGPMVSTVPFLLCLVFLAPSILNISNIWLIATIAIFAFAIYYFYSDHKNNRLKCEEYENSLDGRVSAKYPYRTIENIDREINELNRNKSIKKIKEKLNTFKGGDTQVDSVIENTLYDVVDVGINLSDEVKVNELIKQKLQSNLHQYFLMRKQYEELEKQFNKFGGGFTTIKEWIQDGKAKKEQEIREYNERVRSGSTDFELKLQLDTDIIGYEKDLGIAIQQEKLVAQDKAQQAVSKFDIVKATREAKKQRQGQQQEKAKETIKQYAKLFVEKSKILDKAKANLGNIFERDNPVSNNNDTDNQYKELEKQFNKFGGGFTTIKEWIQKGKTKTEQQIREYNESGSTDFDLKLQLDNDIIGYEQDLAIINQQEELVAKNKTQEDAANFDPLKEKLKIKQQKQGQQEKTKAQQLLFKQYEKNAKEDGIETREAIQESINIIDQQPDNIKTAQNVIQQRKELENLLDIIDNDNINALRDTKQSTSSCVISLRLY